MDKSNFQEIEKLIQKNSGISGFDLYYLGFFSYYVQKISLEDTFKHLSNIISLHHDHLITNEVKIDLLIKMLSNKIDFRMLNIVSAENGGDVENETKKVLNEYFNQIMKIIPKYTSISNFELFYLGRFHAIYPSYKIAELFQHVNNINTLVSEDLIDEETQIDFLLKILNKKLKSNNNKDPFLNIPKEDAEKDQSQNQIKQEPKPQENVRSEPQGRNQVSSMPEKEKESVPLQPLQPQNEKPLEENKNIEQVQAESFEKQSNLEEENKVEQEKEIQDIDSISGSREANHHEQSEVKIENQMDVEKPASSHRDNVENHDQDIHEAEKSFSNEAESMEQEHVEEEKGELERKKTEMSEKDVKQEEENEKNHPASDHSERGEEKEDLEENTTEQFEAPPSRNDFQATLFVAEDRMNRQDTNFTEENTNEAANIDNQSMNNEELDDQSRENQSNREKESEQDQNENHSERERESMQEEINDKSHEEDREDEKKNNRNEENSVDLEYDNKAAGANEEEEKDLSFEGQTNNVEPRKQSSANMSQHTEIDQEANKDEGKNTPQQESEQLKDISADVSEKKADDISDHSRDIDADENEKKNEPTHQNAEKAMDESLSANLEENRGLMVLNETQQSISANTDPNIQISKDKEDKEEKKDEMLGVEHRLDESLASHESTQNLITTLYPKPKEDHKMGTLDEILDNLLDDDKSEDNQASQQREAFSKPTNKDTQEKPTLAENASLSPRNEEVSEKDKASQQSQEVPDKMQVEERPFNTEDKPKSLPNTISDQSHMEIEEPKRNQENNITSPVHENIQSQNSEYQRSSSEIQDSSQNMRPTNMVIPESQFSQPDQSLILRWKKHHPENTIRRIGTDESVAEEIAESKPASNAQESANVGQTTIKQESSQLKAILEAATQADDPEEEEYFEAPPSRHSQNIEQKPKNTDTTQVARNEMNLEESKKELKETDKEIKLEFKADTIPDMSETNEYTLNQTLSRPQTQDNEIEPPVNQSRPLNQGNSDSVQPRKEVPAQKDQIPQILIKPDPKETQQVMKEQEQVQKLDQRVSQPPVQTLNLNSCIICRKDLSAKSTKTLEICKDTFHEDCMRDYLEEKVDEKFFPIDCPKQNCKQKLRLVDIMDFLSQDYLEDYVMFTLKLYVDQKTNVACCPTPGCAYAFFKKNQTKFQCPVCKKIYCLNCQMEWHQGVACSYYEEQKRKREKRGGITLENTQTSKFKRCLKCDTWVAKIQGFNILHCQCGNKFCYTCGKEREERGCECLKNQSCRPVVHPEVFHEAMQTPENFKNFDQNQIEVENPNRQPVRSQPQSTYSYKPAPDQSAITDPLVSTTRNIPANKRANEVSDDDLSYKGDQEKPKDMDDDDLSYKGDDKKRIEEDDISYKGDQEKKDADDDLSYKGDDRKHIEEDDISYKGDQEKPKDMDDDDLSYKGDDKKRIEEDDISYQGSPRRNNDASSDISA